jgi:glycosyltransferase involved in cell wall biosynthesis
MDRLKVHLLYEYGANKRPHAPSSLRLLRPFSYPAVREKIEVSTSRDLDILEFLNPDLIMVDRLWRSDIRPQMVSDLVDLCRRKGAKLVYWFDDNFLALDKERVDILDFQESFTALLEQSDCCVVSSGQLKDTFGQRPNVFFWPSTLDERIIANRLPVKNPDGKIVVGYMGSSTHDEDLRMIIPSLQAVNERYPGLLSFEFIGVVNPSGPNWGAIHSLPAKVLSLGYWENEYPMFMLWFTSTTRWDVGIAPLVDNAFNRYKSDIKYLDYAAAGIPGIFSAVPAYQNSVVDHFNGLLVENTTAAWTVALDELIRDEALREKIWLNSSQYLYQKRILARCAGDLVDMLYQMVK